MALPKYDQIAADLRGQIVRGDLKPNDLLPSAQQLSERWDTTRTTVSKAIGVLVQEGLVESRQGVGTRVVERAPLARTAGERYQTSVATGQIYTAGEYADILSAEMVPAPDHVATALGIQEGDQVLRRHRVTHEGETPTATSWSYFTTEVAGLAPRLLQRERIREGTTRYVEMQTGRRPHTARDTWTARLATPEERELLGLEDPSAVAESRHTAWCAEGRPLTYEVGIAPGGRWARTEEYLMQPHQS